MLVSEKERKSIRNFVCGQLSDEPDLSTLTLGILKKQYLAHVGCDSLSPQARNFMKQVVQEELLKMQDNDENGDELQTKKVQIKRKREKENDEAISEGEDESTAKKSRRQSSLSSESDNKNDPKTKSEESEEDEQVKSDSEDEEQEEKKSQKRTNGRSKKQISSDGSSDEEIIESEKEEKERSDSPKEKVTKKTSSTKNGETGSSDTGQEKGMAQSDEENNSDSDNGSEKSDGIDGNDSSDDSDKEDKVSVEKQNDDQDSDSSSLPSLEDEEDKEKENTEDKKKKTVKKEKKEKSDKRPKDDNKAVVRLKRYIALCGVRRNYKKLLEGCRSVRSQVAALKKELEDLGIDGPPTIKKCKEVRKKREETQELADLDVSNIITTQGRPKRRGAWQEQPEPPSDTYQCALNSSSDSDQDNNIHRGRKRARDWANLQGIISDDADSD